MQTRYASGRRAGITERDVDHLSDYEHGPFTEREKAALRYADDVFLDPHRVEPAVRERARLHFSEPELVELTWAIGLWVETGRMFHALEVPYGPVEGSQVDLRHGETDER
jgi:alkylhydroperoxidase family enzyme